MPTAPDSPELSRPARLGGWKCVTDLGFWAAVPAEGRRPVLASGCGTVSTFRAEPTTVEVQPPRADPPQPEHLRALVEAPFARGAGAE